MSILFEVCEFLLSQGTHCFPHVIKDCILMLLGGILWYASKNNQCQISLLATVGRDVFLCACSLLPEKDISIQRETERLSKLLLSFHFKRKQFSFLLCHHQKTLGICLVLLQTWLLFKHMRYMKWKPFEKCTEHVQNILPQRLRL